MDTPETHELTQLLVAWGAGDEAALNQLAPLVHDELRRLAKRYMTRERDDHLLQTRISKSLIPKRVVSLSFDSLVV
jgi:ECF sigma factor